MPFLPFSLPGAEKSRGILLAIVALLAGLSLSGQPWDSSTPASATRQVNVSPAPEQPATKAVFGHVAQTTREQIKDTYGKLPLSFEVNDGQFDARVKFLSRGSGYSFFLTSTEAVLALNRAVTGGADKLPPFAQRRKAKQRAAHTRPEVLRMRLAGANPAPAITGVDALPGTSNYFAGNDAARWRTNVAHYARVRYEEVYPGIDLVYYGNQRQLEYDFVVAAGADPELIRVKFAGARKVEIERGGDLVLHTSGGQVRQHKPFVYQEVEGGRQQVASSYVLTGKHEIGFRLARYDATKPLIIDPVLVYSTYLGGNNSDTGYDIAVDGAGNAYITGQTTSTDFPTQNPVQSAPSQIGDVFITKLNPTGDALVYSTYVGGNEREQGYAIEVDNAGNAYVTGSTSSSDFPKANAYDSTFVVGSLTPFLLKLNATGDALLYSTYVGSSGEAYALGVDKTTGEAYIAGYTSAPDFPVTPGALQTAKAAGEDAFITKFNAQGSGLIYSTYLGSNSRDVVYGIAVDPGGNVYATGHTTSFLFFVSPNALDKTCGQCERGRPDGFVVKLNPQGSDLIYSTFLGGFFSDLVYGIDVDSSGHAYVTGSTGGDFPITANAFDSTDNGLGDVFVSKINSTASELIYSTYLGGTGQESGSGIKVDAAGNIHITGVTSSTGFGGVFFPTTNSLTPIVSGKNNPFVTKFNATGTALIYSTTFGVSEEGGAFGLALDASANAYVTGSTTNTVPLTPGAFQTTRSGRSDAFVAKIAPSDSDGITPSITISNVRVTEGNSGTTNADFTATLSAPSDRTVTFDYSTANITAGNNDYQSAQGTISFAPGETSKVLSIAVIGDLADEADETFQVRLVNAVGGIITTSSGTGTIVDDDEPLPTPVASINDATVTEGNSGTTSAVFTISLSNASAETVFVDFNTLPGTAHEGEDYQARAGRLTFASGETSKTVAILVNGDTTSEPDETFIVELSRAINAHTGRRQGHATILNDDSPPTPTWTARDIAVGGDNKLRGLWTHTDGRAALWTVSPVDGSFEFNRSYGPYQGWTAKAIAAGTDNKTRALWTNADGRAALWVVSPADGNLEFNATYGPYSNWTATDLAVGADNKLRVLWRHTDGRAALWVVGANGSLEVNDTYGPYSGWSAQALAAGADNKFRVLWANVDGRAALWTLGADRSFEFNGTYGPYGGWTVRDIAVGSDNQTRALWTHTDGRAALWVVRADESLAFNSTYGPYSGWSCEALAAGTDNLLRALWTHTDGRAALWVVGADGNLQFNSTYGPY